VAPIARSRFRLAGPKSEGISAEVRARIPFGDEASAELVFINGYLAAELSHTRGLPDGAKAASLGAILGSDPERVEPYLARLANPQDRSFVALNTAFMRDGAFVHVPSGKVVETPIVLIFLSSAKGGSVVSHPRNLIVMGDNSQAVVMECYLGWEKDVYFTNAVTEIVAGENAGLTHYKLEVESEEAFHIGALEAQIGRSSIFTSHSIQLGGALARNDTHAVLAGEGSECTLNGLYMVGGRRHADNHTRIDHVKPHSTSRELYKGILHGRSRGVFNGKIYVHKAAQKTDARQTNKNLLLSEDALINTKPDLEIYADDVKCTHGSTIGQVDPNQIFYLRSRGLGELEAQRLLTYAFASEMLVPIRLGSIQTWLNQRVTRILEAS
jgi:Fe-S cluster assembly protein SufD